MTGRGHQQAGAGSGAAAGHVPVLLDAAIGHLQVTDGARIVDGTFGAGGYARAILVAGGRVLGVDRDPAAEAVGKALEAEYPRRFRFASGRFSDLDRLAEAAGFAPADGVVLDVGVSSMQFDDPARGFSFRRDGPLDMRMSGEGASAADIVNGAPPGDLTAIIRRLGEERHAGRIARAIAEARADAPITGTKRLATIVETAAPVRGPQRIHPATRTFQALRIFVNRELEELGLALGAAERVLAAGGRLVVVAFHSLEDRIVKRFLQQRGGAIRGSRHAPPVAAARPTFAVPRGQPVAPSEAELARNPRARSARLRHAVRTEAPAAALDLAALGVPLLADISGPEAYA